MLTPALPHLGIRFPFVRIGIQRLLIVFLRCMCARTRFFVLLFMPCFRPSPAGLARTPPRSVQPREAPEKEQGQGKVRLGGPPIEGTNRAGTCARPHNRSPRVVAKSAMGIFLFFTSTLGSRCELPGGGSLGRLPGDQKSSSPRGPALQATPGAACSAGAGFPLLTGRRECSHIGIVACFLCVLFLPLGGLVTTLSGGKISRLSQLNDACVLYLGTREQRNVFAWPCPGWR